MSCKVPEKSDFASMAEADKLCDLLFLWLKKRKQCAEKLLALVKELENVHKISAFSQVVGSATSVVALSTAGIATFLTGGLATPLLVATTVGTLAGAAVDIGSSAIEAIMSSSTMNEAKNIIREDEKIGKDIQKAIENLKKKCVVQQNGAHGPTDVGCEVATQIMGALARRNNIDVPLYSIRSFVRSTFSQNLGGSHAAGAVSKQLTFAAVTFVCYQLGIECFKKGLESSAKGLGRSVASSGAKLLGVIGLGISLYSLFSSCEEMLKSKEGTKASRALQNLAREIQEARRSLEEQLDAMKKILQEIEQEQQRIKEIEREKQSIKQIEQEQQRIKQIEREKQSIKQIEQEQQRIKQIEREKQRIKVTDEEESSSEEEDPPAVNVGLLNVRSIQSIKNMKGKRVKISELIAIHNLDVFLMTETWLENETAAVALREAAPQTFEFYQNSRVGRGGGVAIQFSPRLCGERIHFDHTTTFEHVATALRHVEWDEDVLFINVYQPGTKTIAQFCEFADEFEMLLKEASTLYNCIVVAGDFNLDHRDTFSLKLILFKIIHEKRSFKQHVDEPTHKQGGILDLVFSRNVEVSCLVILDDKISDHFSVYFRIRPK